MTAPIIYLDYNASTPVDRRVQIAMFSTLAEVFANPSSNHAAGHEAHKLVEGARRQVAAVVNMSKSDVIFVSGATEANNLAIRGAFDEDERYALLVGATEHKSVIDTAIATRDSGRATLEIIDVNSDGLLNTHKLNDALSKYDGNILVSVMAANSETGVINPIGKIAEIVHSHHGILHCDATQAIGKIPFDASVLDVDMVSMSSHKIYGPKGVGALLINKSARQILCPVQTGGGQENGLRSGTLNVSGIVGFGKACEIAADMSTINYQHTLRNNLEELIESSIKNICINGKEAERLPNTTNIRFVDADSDAVLANMSNVAVSTGSACSSSTIEPSHVLMAMGLEREAANESIRFSLGMDTTQNDIVQVAIILKDAVERVRRIDVDQTIGSGQYAH